MEVLFRCKFEVTKHAVKKNGRPIFKRGAKVFIGKSAKLVSAESELQYLIEKSKYSTDRFFDIPISEYINATFIFTFPEKDFYTKKGARNKKIADISNLYEIVQDSLQKCRVIENDSLIESHDGSRRISGDKYELEIILRRSCEQKILVRTT